MTVVKMITPSTHLLQVVIATPARLRNIVEHHLEEVELAHVQQLVLDEVDCLLHMGFQDQVSAIYSYDVKGTHTHTHCVLLICTVMLICISIF